VKWSSIRLSVCLSHLPAAAACSGFAAVNSACRQYQSIAAWCICSWHSRLSIHVHSSTAVRRECKQCLVYSHLRRLTCFVSLVVIDLVVCRFYLHFMHLYILRQLEIRLYKLKNSLRPCEHRQHTWERRLAESCYGVLVKNSFYTWALTSRQTPVPQILTRHRNCILSVKNCCIVSTSLKASLVRICTKCLYLAVFLADTVIFDIFWQAVEGVDYVWVKIWLAIENISCSEVWMQEWHFDTADDKFLWNSL